MLQALACTFIEFHQYPNQGRYNKLRYVIQAPKPEKLNFMEEIYVGCIVDIVKYLDGALVQKISKRHFFEDI